MRSVSLSVAELLIFVSDGCVGSVFILQVIGCLVVSCFELVVLGETSLGFPERFGVAVNAVDGVGIVRDEIMSSRKCNKTWNIHACTVPRHAMTKQQYCPDMRQITRVH